MAAWCGERTTAEALAALDAARIPAGPVLSPQQVLDDAHVRAIGFLRPVAAPGSAAETPVAETPFSLSAAPAGIRGRAPELGEHTDGDSGRAGLFVPGGRGAPRTGRDLIPDPAAGPGSVRAPSVSGGVNRILRRAGGDELPVGGGMSRTRGETAERGHPARKPGGVAMRNWFFRDHGHAGRRRGVVVCSGDDDSSSPLQPSPLSTSPSGGA